MRVIDRERKRASLDTTRRLKAAHRRENVERGRAKEPPLSLRAFVRAYALDAALDAGELAGYAKQWLADKRATDHPKRARSRFVLDERRQRRWSRRAKGNPKGKKAK